MAEGKGFSFGNIDADCFTQTIGVSKRYAIYASFNYTFGTRGAAQINIDSSVVTINGSIIEFIGKTIATIHGTVLHITKGPPRV